MTKAELQAQLEAKKGFHSIIEDKLAPDHVQGDLIEKRYFYVNHTNADGTMGKTFVYYMHDVENDVASFYNVEPAAIDTKESSPETKELQLLENYLATNFAGFFIGRFDLNQKIAEADVFEASGTNLVQKKVLVYKKGSSPITHKEVTTV